MDEIDDVGAVSSSIVPIERVPAEPHLGWALAGMSAGAAAIHLAMTPVHASVWQDALGFSAVAWFQLVTAGAVLANRGAGRFYAVVAAANAAFVGAWAISRTAGLPWGDVEDVAAIDAAAVALEVGVVVLALRLALAPAPARRATAGLAPALAAIGALGLATVVITSPDAADHHSGAAAASVQDPADLVDRTRCDAALNIPAYWDEAATLGVDTRWGGDPPSAAGQMVPGDGHAGHGAAVASAGAPTTAAPADPFEGRGSAGLDALVEGTGLAAMSEVEAAKFIATLSDASDEDYEAWLLWLRSSTSHASHDAAPAASGEPSTSGHGGHSGPQPWVAMTEPALCDQLVDELDEARAVTERYPTMQDALDAGYEPDTLYLPGIGNHVIRRDILDATFDITQPEMILYDGNHPESHVVGLSYQIQLDGGSAPTQGFTGPNDHGHRHMGLCYSTTDGTVIGDSTTTSEECEALGGNKGDGRRGWMNHVWIVPGCESPWGVFSAANPVLDHHLGNASGTNDGGCAGSGVRDRYRLDEPASSQG